MDDRESMLPLAVSGLVAVALHVLFIAALPTLWTWDAAFATVAPDEPLAEAEDQPRPKLELGRDEKVVPTSVAWISYDDVRELLARQTNTEQPVLQMQADPVPGAPLLIDATPPGPPTTSREDGMTAVLPELAQSPPAELPLPAPTPPIPVPPTTAVEAGEPVLSPIDLPLSQLAELPAPSPMPPLMLVQPEPLAQVEPTPSPDEGEREPSQQPANERPRPTSAPRSDRESPPTAIEQRLTGSRTGGVLVMDGLEVRTVAPRVGIVSYLTSAPQDAIVEITFGRDGRVTRVDLKQSTRYVDIDAAIESAAYRWRAQGEKLKDAPHTIVVTFKH